MHYYSILVKNVENTYDILTKLSIIDNNRKLIIDYLKT